MLILDIETIKDFFLDSEQINWYIEKKRDKRLKSEEKVKENVKKVSENFGLDPVTGQIILIGIATDSPNILQSPHKKSEQFYYQHLGLNGENERDTIHTFWDILNKAYVTGHRLVTFNGKKFDMPFLFVRSVINNISPPNTLPPIDTFLRKYDNVHHVDLFQVFGEKHTLAEWANRILPDEPISAEGNKIQQWYDEGKYSEIIAKNLDDLEQVSKIYERVALWI